MPNYIAKYSVHYVGSIDGKPVMMSTKIKGTAHKFGSETEAMTWGRKLFGKDMGPRLTIKIIPVQD